MEKYKRFIPYFAPFFLLLAIVLNMFLPTYDWLRYSALILMLVFLGLLFFVRKNDIVLMFKKRGVRQGTSDLSVAFILLGILVVLNYIASNHELKKDFTKNKINSLSEQSVNILKNTKEEITFIAFLKTTDSYFFRKTIDMYTYYNKNIKFEIVDPNKDPVKTETYGIDKYGIVVVKNSKGSETRFEEITEENITNALIKLSRTERKSIYFIEGHGERSIDSAQQDGYSRLKEMLENQSYNVSKVSLLELEQIPHNASLVIIAGPQKSMFDKEAQLVSDYFKNGGAVLLMSDPSTGRRPVKPTDNIGKILNKTTQVILRDDLIIDPMSRLFGMSEAMPVVKEYDTNSKITANFNIATLFPLSQSLDLSKVSKDYFQISEFCRTTSESWGERDAKEGRITFDSGTDIKGPLTLCVSLDGIKEEQKGSMIVFGNSSFATNQFLNHAGNSDLILNSISYLLKDEDLISIRPKTEDKGSFVMPVGRVNFLGIVSVYLMPALILIGGIVFWLRRRKL